MSPRRRRPAPSLSAEQRSSLAALLAALARPDLPAAELPALLTQAADLRFASALAQLLARPDTPAPVVAELWARNEPWLWSAILATSHATVAMVTQTLDRSASLAISLGLGPSELRLARQALDHPHCPPHHRLAGIARGGLLGRLLAGSTTLTAAEATALASQQLAGPHAPDDQILATLGQNPRTPSAVLVRLIPHALRRDSLGDLAGHPAADENLLGTLLDHRARVTGSPTLPLRDGAEHHLHLLATRLWRRADLTRGVPALWERLALHTPHLALDLLAEMDRRRRTLLRQLQVALLRHPDREVRLAVQRAVAAPPPPRRRRRR